MAIENQCKAKTEPDCFLIRFLGLSGITEPSAWEICARKSLFSFFLRSAQANMESYYNILDSSVLKKTLCNSGACHIACKRSWEMKYSIRRGWAESTHKTPPARLGRSQRWARMSPGSHPALAGVFLLLWGIMPLVETSSSPKP